MHERLAVLASFPHPAIINSAARVSVPGGRPLLGVQIRQQGVDGWLILHPCAFKLRHVALWKSVRKAQRVPPAAPHQIEA